VEKTPFSIEWQRRGLGRKGGRNAPTFSSRPATLAIIVTHQLTVIITFLGELEDFQAGSVPGKRVSALLSTIVILVIVVHLGLSAVAEVYGEVGLA
jgi:hypothetical protein